MWRTQGKPLERTDWTVSRGVCEILVFIGWHKVTTYSSNALPSHTAQTEGNWLTHRKEEHTHRFKLLFLHKGVGHRDGGILGIVQSSLSRLRGRPLSVLCCWHQMSRHFSKEGEWLHMAGLLLKGRKVEFTAAEHLSWTQTWGWTQVLFLFSSLL